MNYVVERFCFLSFREMQYPMHLEMSYEFNSITDKKKFKLTDEIRYIFETDL